MPIISSQVVFTSQQAGGLIRTVEKHIDSTGGEHIFEYLASASDNVNAILAARIPVIEENLANAEFEEVLRGI